ncbi:MAG: tetratricopeptide repeat protein [Treponema sp.]|jgi:tetratricopeptide (TPR) repeat protein|nr:tetratricopeptide repeat protein [Treponema sp.]
MNNLALQDSLEALLDAIDAEPNRAELHIQAGNIQKKLGNLKAASMAYARAVELDPHNREAYNNLGIVFYEMGEKNRALNILRQAANLWAEDPLIQFNYGIAQESAGRFEEAAAAYRIALEKRPGWRAALNNLGALQNKAGHPEKAPKAFQAAPGEAAGMIPAEEDAPGEAPAEGAALRRVLRERAGSSGAAGTGGISQPNLIGLMRYLRELAGGLTGTLREDFIHSDARLGLEYIIDALEGRKGLFREIRDQHSPKASPAEPETGEPRLKDVADTLKFLKGLASSLPDGDLGVAINRKVDKVIQEIQEPAEKGSSHA